MVLTDVSLENKIVIGEWAETLLVVIIEVVPKGLAHEVLFEGRQPLRCTRVDEHKKTQRIWEKEQLAIKPLKKEK